MRLVTVVFAAAALAAAVTPCAIAAPAVHLTDVQFLAANRCLGLLSSKTIGTSDAAAMAKLIRDQSWGRDGYVYDRADQAKDDAESAAGRAGAEARARLIAERDGVCRSLLGETSTTANGVGAVSTIR